MVSRLFASCGCMGIISSYTCLWENWRDQLQQPVQKDCSGLSYLVLGMNRRIVSIFYALWETTKLRRIFRRKAAKFKNTIGIEILKLNQSPFLQSLACYIQTSVAMSGKTRWEWSLGEWGWCRGRRNSSFGRREWGRERGWRGRGRPRRLAGSKKNGNFFEKRCRRLYGGNFPTIKPAIYFFLKKPSHF